MQDTKHETYQRIVTNPVFSYGALSPWKGYILQVVEDHPEPIEFLTSVLLLKNAIMKIQPALIPLLLNSLKKQPNPRNLIEAILVMSQTSLLSAQSHHAEANLKKLIAVANTWFDDRTLARLFKSTSTDAFTQSFFDSLIEESSDRTNLGSTRFNISMALYDKGMFNTPRETDMPPITQQIVKHSVIFSGTQLSSIKDSDAVDDEEEMHARLDTGPS